MNFERDPLSNLELPNETGTPERNLLMAILERAILDYVGNDSREVEEAEHWLFSELNEPRYNEFSFPWLCQELDLDYEKIARKIREMPKRGSQRIAPWHFTKHTQVQVTEHAPVPVVVNKTTIGRFNKKASSAKHSQVRFARQSEILRVVAKAS